MSAATRDHAVGPTDMYRSEDGDNIDYGESQSSLREPTMETNGTAQDDFNMQVRQAASFSTAED